MNMLRSLSMFAVMAAITSNRFYMPEGGSYAVRSVQRAGYYHVGNNQKKRRKLIASNQHLLRSKRFSKHSIK